MRSWLALLLAPMSVVAQGPAHESWRVAGTVIGGNSSMALIENAAGIQRELRVGDILDGCKLGAITPRGLALDCAGTIRWRALEPDDRPVAAPKNTPAATAELSGQAFRDLLGDRQRLVSEISLKPRVRDGRLDGYEVEHLKSGGLLEGHGLIAGDVILAVNGAPASQPQGFMDMIRHLEDAPDFLLQLEHDGVLRELLVQLR
jgi:type II secretion system protein C